MRGSFIDTDEIYALTKTTTHSLYLYYIIFTHIHASAQTLAHALFDGTRRLNGAAVKLK